MNLRQIALVILLCAAALALVSYESYRSNVEFVTKLASSPDSAEMFSKLEPGIPMRSKVSGFFAVMLSVAGLRLLLTSYFRSAALNASDGQDKMLKGDA